MSNGGSYDPKTIEPGIYESWEQGGYFNADPDTAVNSQDFQHEAHEEHKGGGVNVAAAAPTGRHSGGGRKPYVVMMPPPNVTGALHLGHAMYTLQDVLVRWKRMCGYNALWMPGIDHAGIATQAVVEKRLREEKGLTRHEVGREGLVAKIWEWKEEYGQRILSQLRKLGVSCDWRRTRFTLDETCARAVYEMFFELFKAGLIYRGLRLVNWDTQLQTAVADDEVYHETVKGSLWHIRYPIEGTKGPRDQGTKGPRDQGTKGPRDQGTEGGKEDQSKIQNPKSKIDAEGEAGILPASASVGADYLIVATTRPETMLADTAVAVHPEDERYRHLIGKRVALPLTGRTIPVIADGELVKREFGTGCVKVTPGHDPNDYACYQRHKGQADEIGIRNMMTPDGRVHAENAGLPAAGETPAPPTGTEPGKGGAGVSPAAGNPGRYAGLKLEEARKKVVADLEAAGLLEKVEPYETDVGHSDRSKTQIQPYLSEQWFVKMGRKEGADGGPALAELTMEAVRDGRVQFFPARYANTYLDWLGEKRDWCISRQLWWGHRIPVWRPRDKWLSGALAQMSISQTHAALDKLRQDYPGNVDWRFSDALDDWNRVDLCICVRRSCPEIEKKLGDWGLEQDPDVLDTWFSSALWPMNTLGWPHGDQNPDRKGGVLGASAATVRSTPATSKPLPSGRGSDAQPLPTGRGSDDVLPSRQDYDYFFPTDVLCTGRGIITLWVARMVMNALYFTKRVPFRHVYINPTILDGHGQVMSKSKGNGVDPLDIIELYGTDALRFTLAQMATETQDIRMPVKPVKLPDGRQVNGSDKFEAGRNLANKLWQAANGLVLPSLQGVKIERKSPQPSPDRKGGVECEADPSSKRPLPDGRGSAGGVACDSDRAVQGAGWYHTSVAPPELPLFDRWIRTRLQHCIAAVDEHLSNYRFSAAADELRGFFWTEFCDWYLEEIKVRLRELQEGPNTTSEEDRRRANDLKVVLLGVFDSILALFHPIMPFVTEAIWKRIGEAVPRHYEIIWDHAQTPPATAPALIVAPWPRKWAEADDALVDREVGDVLQPVIRALRDIRASVNSLRSAAKQPALRTLPKAAVRANAEASAQLVENLAMIQRLGNCDSLEIGPNVARPAESASKVLAGIEVYVPLTGLADLEIERKRLRKDLDDLTPRIEQLMSKLADANFTAKAPAQLVEKEHARLAEMQGRAQAMGKNLAELGG